MFPTFKCDGSYALVRHSWAGSEATVTHVKTGVYPIKLTGFFLNISRWCRLRHAYYDDHTLMSFSGAFHAFHTSKNSTQPCSFTKFERNKSVRSPRDPRLIWECLNRRLFHKIVVETWNCFFCKKKRLQLTSDDETSPFPLLFLLTLLFRKRESLHVHGTTPPNSTRPGIFSAEKNVDHIDSARVAKLLGCEIWLEIMTWR